jgi:hypothetical protein
VTIALTVAVFGALAVLLMVDMQTDTAPLVPPGDRSPHDLTSPHRSSPREKVLEYRFLADVTAELYRRGLEFDVLRSDVDALGHDLVIEANGIIRHIQLKATYHRGKTARVTSNIRLATRPSGCLIWMIYDPHTLGISAFRWFGGAPGAPLPDVGARIAKHSRCNTDGIKAVRPAHRVLPKRAFAPIGDIATLVDQLFGSAKLPIPNSGSTGKPLLDP